MKLLGRIRLIWDAGREVGGTLHLSVHAVTLHDK